MSVTGCLVSDMLLGKQCLNESAIIAGGGGRSEEQGEMTAEYRYTEREPFLSFNGQFRFRYVGFADAQPRR